MGYAAREIRPGRPPMSMIPVTSDLIGRLSKPYRARDFGQSALEVPCAISYSGWVAL